MSCKELLLDQIAEMIFKRVAACPCGTYHVAHGHAALIADIIENLNGQFGQLGDNDFFALDRDGEAALLLLQGAREEYKPRLPIRLFRAD